MTRSCIPWIGLILSLMERIQYQNSKLCDGTSLEHLSPDPSEMRVRRRRRKPANICKVGFGEAGSGGRGRPVHSDVVM